jgi:hypothetical protein
MTVKDREPMCLRTPALFCCRCRTRTMTRLRRVPQRIGPEHLVRQLFLLFGPRVVEVGCASAAAGSASSATTAAKARWLDRIILIESLEQELTRSLSDAVALAAATTESSSGPASKIRICTHGHEPWTTAALGTRPREPTDGGRSRTGSEFTYAR